MDLQLPEFTKPKKPQIVKAVNTALADDIEIVVLAHKAKQSITVETLGMLDLPYRIYENQEWDWPSDHPELTTDRSEREMIRGYALRQYRAWRGHQEICISAKKPFTLVFEDDMSLEESTNPEEVMRHINGARNFISQMGYDAVSFHARQQTPPQKSITYYGREYVELGVYKQEAPDQQKFLKPVAESFNGKYKNYEFAWHEGCLAYLIAEPGRSKWIGAEHDGMPCDLFLANELNLLVMRHTLFNHDERNGSLIANTGRAERALNDDGTEKAARA